MEFLAALLEGLGHVGSNGRKRQENDPPKRPRKHGDRIDFWIIMTLMTGLLGVIVIIIIAGNT